MPSASELLTAFKSAFSTPGFGGVQPSRRVENAWTIVSECLAEGVPFGIALAAVVNADAESGLNDKAVGDSGACVGLFQLEERGGGAAIALPRVSGQPDPKDPRFDPRTNTKAILQQYKHYGSRVRSAYDNGSSVSTLAGLWAYDVERPTDLVGEQAARSARAVALFGPALASVPANTLSDPRTAISKALQDVEIAVTGQAGGPNWLLIGTSVVAVSAIGGLIYWRHLRPQTRMSLSSST